KYLSAFCIVFLLVLVNSYFNKTKAQCPPNIDFEYGDFSNWAYGYGNTNSLYPTQSTPIPFGLRDTTPITPLKVQIITPFTTPLNDPYGGFPILCPNGSGSSVRLGNDYIGAEEDALQYKFHVPSTSTNYSLTYQYAVVLQNPSGHTAAEQPRFMALVSDSATGALITCASYDFVSDTSLPGFFISPISYDTAGILNTFNIILCRSWTPASINLKGYGGHTMYLTFISFDCTRTGHFGYAYVDVNSQCGSNAIINSYCWNSTSATLTAPPGFKKYHWYNSTYTVSIDTVQSPTIPLPTTTTTYAVICSPYPGYGCIDTFLTTVTPILPPKPTANFSIPNTYCASSILNFTNLSTSNISGISITKYKWDFGDPNATGNSAPPNPDTSLLQNPQHLYSDTGTYTVTLSIETAAGCQDTLIKNIRIALPPPNVPISVSKDSVCAVVDTVTLNWTGTLSAGFTPIWSLNPGTNLISGNIVSTGPIVVSFDTIGNHYIGFTVVPPFADDSTCWAHKDVAIYAKGFYPNINIMGIDTVCYGNATKLFFDIETANCSYSSRKCNAPDSYTIGTTLNTSSTISSPIAAIPSYPKSKAQYLFSATELKSFGITAGAIKGLGFTITTKNSSTALHDFSIKLACVNYNSFSKISPFTFDTLSTRYLVYNNNSYSTVLGLNQFIFDTSFAWNGTSNLLVEICYDNTGFSTAGLNSDAVRRTVMPSGNANSVYGIASPLETEAACSQFFPRGLASTHIISATKERPQFTFLACNGSYIPSGTTYSWTSNPVGFASTADSIFISPTANTTYFVTASNFGCTNSDSIKVAVFNTSIKAGNDTTICFAGTQKSLTISSTTIGGGTNTYLWSVKPSSAVIFNPSNPNPTVIVQANTIDTFVVTMTGGGCTLNDTMIVYASSKPTITKTKDSLICQYDTIQLVLSSNQLNTTYSWTSNHDSLSCYNCYNPTSIITQIDTFNFIATNAYGCTTVEKIKVTPKPVPTATFTATSPVCPNVNSTLTYTGNAGNGATYNWNFANGSASPGGTVQGPQSVHWAVSDTYHVVLSVIRLGCSSLPDTQNVIVLPIPTSTFSVNNAHCEGDTLTLTYTGNGATIAGADPLWTIPSSASIVSGSIASFGPIKVIPAIGSSIYSLTVGNGSCAGVAFKDTITIAPNPTSNFSVTSPICLTSKSTITYTGGALSSSKFNWNFDGGASTIQDTLVGPHSVQWLNANTKNVSLWVNENGCKSDTTTHQIQILQTPTANFSVNAAHCIGDTIEVIYTGNGKSIAGSSAIWNISPTPTFLVGNTSTLDTLKFIPSIGNTIINLIVTNGTCSDTLQDTVTIFNYPTNTFTATSPVCPNQNSTLNYTGNATLGATFNWNYDGGVNAGNNVKWSSSGIYNVSLSVTQNGCTSGIDTVTVSVLQTPTSTFTKSNAHCLGDTVTLVYTGDAKTISGANLKWRFNPIPNYIVGDSTTADTIKFIPTIGNTTIQLIASNSNCSSSSFDTITIYSYPTNLFTVSNDTACTPSTSLVTYTGSASTTAIYNWNFNSLSTTPGGTSKGPHTVSIPNAGDYNISLFVTENGCTSDTSFHDVKVYQSPAISISRNNPNCKGDTLTLTYSSPSEAAPLWTIPSSALLINGTLTGYSALTVLLDTGLNYISVNITEGICSSTANDSVRIYQIPTSNFNINPITNCTSLASTLTYSG
ncbi:MAG: hypothetical protein RL065_1797, partial [Bacteroidota bacterium]